MSFLADIFTYWNGNGTLTGAIPYTQVWTGLAPESVTYPYAVIVSIGEVPTYTTGTGYLSQFSFQISIFDTDPDNAESLANTVAGQFDYKSVASANVSCIRTNGPILLADEDTQRRVYHVMLEYDLMANRTLPNT